MFIETKAIIANARIMTTTGATLLRQGMERQVGFQTQGVYFQLDTFGGREIMSPRVDKWRSQRTICRF
jgi:hypothetical protein